MTNDELRALADALSVPHRELATVDVIRAAAYLRACADAQPVAVVPAKWTERHTSAQTWIEDADQAHDLRLYVSGIMESHDQRIAYARLIAASPELLRTLHQLIVVIERPIKYKSDLDILREAVDEALAVIAKATGRVMVELRAAAEIGRQHD